jgi:tripartite-type tricarboxylate transporter receptor subunit TctC
VAGGASAQSVEEFYKGKSMKMIIGFSAGGGYDVYARAVGRFMEKHVPGNPNIVPQNMTGAGSRRAANYLYNVAPKDGSIIGTLSQAVPLDQTMGEAGVKYDAIRFNWIGNSIADNNITYVWAASGIKTMADALEKGGVVCGATGATSPSVTFPQIINNLTTGKKFKIIRGYPGGSVINLAIERGEVNCRGSNSWSSTKSTQGDLLQEKKIEVLVQWGAKNDPEISKFMGRDVPLITAFATSEDDRKALALVTAGVTIGRPIVAPPDVPADRVAALRAAFDATMKDKEFLAHASKQKMDLNPMTGQELQDLVATVINAPPAAVNRMRQLLEQKDVSDVELKTAEGSISAIEKRNLTIKDAAGKELGLKVHAKRTKVTIGGEKAKTDVLKVGMTCTFSYLGVNAEVAQARCK